MGRHSNNGNNCFAATVFINSMYTVLQKRQTYVYHMYSKYETGHAQQVEAMFSTDVYLSFISPTSNAVKNLWLLLKYDRLKTCSQSFRFQSSCLVIWSYPFEFSIKLGHNPIFEWARKTRSKTETAHEIQMQMQNLGSYTPPEIRLSKP